jgi:hypothetical protein
MKQTAIQVQNRNRDIELAQMGSKSAVKRLVMRQRDYIRAIKPYTDMKADIYSRTLPKMIVYPDGRTEHHYNFTEQQKEILKQCDELIEAVKAQFTGA